MNAIVYGALFVAGWNLAAAAVGDAERKTGRALTALAAVALAALMLALDGAL